MSATSQIVGEGQEGRDGGLWPGGLDFDDLVSRGWAPTPFGLFLFKVHSRCNLDCDYCYVYRMADQSWRRQPRRMSDRVVAQTAQRIREHAQRHGLRRVTVGLHGGEPLLAGPKWLREFFEVITGELADTVDVRFTMQTNGLLVTPDIAETLLAHRVRLGVSLDGGREANDRHRRTHTGQSSYTEVVAALRLLSAERYRPVLGGILCTIDVQTDPLGVYQSLLDFGTASIDFLLPHGNWSSPPPNKDPAIDATPYADWLIPIFDEWYAEPVRRVSVRIFEEIMGLLLGGRSGFEALGVAPVNLVVVETDGTIEGVDTLKSTVAGAAKTGMDVFNHTFDDVLRTPGIMARQAGLDALAPACHRCPIRDVCGGGYFTHRYRADTGFRNPSVYCTDLTRLIMHIRGRIVADLAGRAPR